MTLEFGGTETLSDLGKKSFSGVKGLKLTGVE